jgi:hypothetical protein
VTARRSDFTTHIHIHNNTSVVPRPPKGLLSGEIKRWIGVWGTDDGGLREVGAVCVSIVWGSFPCCCTGSNVNQATTPDQKLSYIPPSASRPDQTLIEIRRSKPIDVVSTRVKRIPDISELALRQEKKDTYTDPRT